MLHIVLCSALHQSSYYRKCGPKGTCLVEVMSSHETTKVVALAVIKLRLSEYISQPPNRKIPLIKIDWKHLGSDELIIGK